MKKLILSLVLCVGALSLTAVGQECPKSKDCPAEKKESCDKNKGSNGGCCKEKKDQGSKEKPADQPKK